MPSLAHAALLSLSAFRLAGEHADTLTPVNADSVYVSTLKPITTYPHWGTSEGVSFSDEGIMYESDMWAVRSKDIPTSAAIKENKLWGMEDVAHNIDSSNVKSSMTGSCVLGNMLYALTWQANLILAYDIHTLELVRKIPVSLGGFGYGISPSSDQSMLYVTSLGPNGTSLLHMNPQTFVVERSLPIFDPILNTRVSIVSELEVVDDELWGNIDSFGPIFGTEPDAPTAWGEEGNVPVSTINAHRNDSSVQLVGPVELGEGSLCIARIDPSTGLIKGWVDASSLLSKFPEQPIAPLAPPNLNGIAKDPVTGKLYVTGKYFNHLHEVRVVPQPLLDAEYIKSTCNFAVIEPIPGIAEQQQNGNMSSAGSFSAAAAQANLPDSTDS